MAEVADVRPPEFFLGEWSRTLDERYRFSLPPEWAAALARDRAGTTASLPAEISPDDSLPSVRESPGVGESSGPAPRGEGKCMLAKERPGCVSLWNRGVWASWLSSGVEVIASKVRSGRLDRRMDHVQLLGRLLSTRHREANIAGRGRIGLPESFRSFLGVEPGGEVLVVGAGVCVEVWSAAAWNAHIGEQMPSFRQLLEQLAE